MIVKTNKNSHEHEHLRRALAARRREISREIQDKIRDVRTEAEGTETSEALDAWGIFEADTERDIKFALIELKAHVIDQINHALSRLDEGVYGYCLECGEKIPERRLRALPFAIRCKDCEEALEVAEERARRGPALDGWFTR